jgi:hypothetical protein
MMTPLLAAIMGALVDRGWTIEGVFDDAVYIAPDGERYGRLDAAILAQTNLELHGYKPDDISGSGMRAEPDLTEPVEAQVYRAMEAIKRAVLEEFADDDLGPNLTVIAALPPDGRVGLASTEPGAPEILLALHLATGMVRRSVRLQAGRQ